MKLLIYGALGRMGRRILALCENEPDIEICGAVDLDESLHGKDIGKICGTGALGVLLSGDLAKDIEKADVVVDFTHPQASIKASAICAENGTPLVVGTTGFNVEEKKALLANTKNIPCVFAPNMSVGVNLLFKLVRETAEIIGEEYDIEITEVHHRFKKDAPSGTARHLGEIIGETLGTPLETYARHGRVGITGERTKKEIGIHALRTGDVVGEHTVTFGTIGERIELVHKAQSRDALASGAIRAIKFVAEASPGLYDMQDVLGLN